MCVCVCVCVCIYSTVLQKYLGTKALERYIHALNKTRDYIPGTCIKMYTPRRVCLVVSMSASHTVGREFASWPDHTIIKMVQNASLHGTQCVRVGV